MNKMYERYFTGVNAYTSGNARLLNQILESKSISAEEKILLIARKLFSLKKHVEAFDLLDKKTNFEDLFLDSERNYLLSNCHSYFSNWENAILYSEKAFLSYKNLKHKRGIFLSGYNLSAFFNRLGLQQISYKYLQEIISSVENEGQKALLARAFSCYYSTQSDYAKAGEQIQIAINKLKDMNFLDQVTTLSVGLDIFFRLKEFEKFDEVLKIIERTKMLRENVRLEFDRICYQMYKNNLYSSSFKPTKSILNSKEYHYKFMILSYLRDGEYKKAQQVWSKLCELMPQRYKDNFKCVIESDEKSLFMTLLFKFSKSSVELDDSLMEGKIKILYNELRKPGAFKRRENLIESIWKVDYDPSYDSRFYKLIERFKKVTGITLIKKNRCYSLSVIQKTG
ncbi:MAG: hypothetical protein A4S09_13415 [Proteobacteria bacterium SG_bin7]|nr:MAG: hypothetical protein A4S09_13415 [Proteobacteria bacterium SG_bin7]